MSIFCVFGEGHNITEGWVNVYPFPWGGIYYGHTWPARSRAIKETLPSAIYRLRIRPWIKHDGGPCPVAPETMVRVKTEDGWIDEEAVPAKEWCEGWWKDYISAYQIMEDA